LVDTEVEEKEVKVEEREILEEKKSPIEESEPKYPKSFGEVMEMVKNGQEVPGIRQISDNISADATELLASTVSISNERQPKPWETKLTPI